MLKCVVWPAILGSRKQLCIHPDVSAASNRDHKCRSYVSAKKCDYHNNLEGKMFRALTTLLSEPTASSFLPKPMTSISLPLTHLSICLYNYSFTCVINAFKFYSFTFSDFKNSEEMREASHEMVADIEEMVRVGQSNSVCPYYLSREMQYNADIIFAPYIISSLFRL